MWQSAFADNDDRAPAVNKIQKISTINTTNINENYYKYSK